jgi:GNAT superfamily N-acetyltransferase
MLELYRQLHFADSPAEPEALQRAWSELLADPKIHLLLAWSDGRAAATCVLVLIPNLTRGARPYGLIENVVTHPDLQRRGIGTRLLRRALELAWERDCYKVMLLTSRKDPGLFQFYEQAGFVRGEKTGFVARPSARGG